MKFNLHVHAWFDMSHVVFGQFVLLVLLTLLPSERTHSLDTGMLEYRSFFDESRLSLQRGDGRVRDDGILHH